jgi:CubicO group peptidase (beta-lactamase class C family)
MVFVKRTVFLVFFALLLCPASPRAQSLGYADPETVGFSRERLDRIASAINADVAAGMIPGATLLIARHGKIAYFKSFGWLNAPTRTPLPNEAIFRIYSMSKPITSVAAMILVEQGKLFLSDPVEKYIPAFAHMQVAAEKPGGGEVELVPAARPITIQDLARHTSGLTYGFFNTAVAKMYRDARLLDFSGTNADFVGAIAKLPLAAQPGSSWNYSNSVDVLGRVVEIVSGKTLYQFEKESILDPLGMSDTGFSVSEFGKQELIAEPLVTDSKVVGLIQISNPRLPTKWEAGGQGMVSTALDYAKFLQMLENGGEFNGHRILSPQTVRFMTSDHLGQIGPGATANLPGAGYGFGIGFAVRREAGLASFEGSAGDYFWLGAGGTSFWNDPKQDLVVVYMMQAPSDGVHYMNLLRNMVYAALTQPEK